MKKLFFIAIILLIFSDLQAQQRFKGALVAGMNVSQIDGDLLIGFNKFGFNAGAQVSTVFTERWEMSVELLYSQRGSDRTRNDGPIIEYNRIDLNYVEVPVMLHFIDWKFHFTGGFAYHRLINFEALNQESEDITEFQNYRENNFGITLGATYFATEHIGFDLRWSRSLLDLQIINNQLIKWAEKWITFRTIYVF
ncbi:MAG: porin family protein [Bacteroidota bacterium]